MENEAKFQSEHETITWKLHFKSSPEIVYRALNTDEGRKHYWAESADETDGHLHYVFLNDIEDTGKILERVENKTFVVMYFDWKVTFTLTPDQAGGTDLVMRCEGVSEKIKVEIIAGWVSWLMAMKGYVDFGIDLRNHDEHRTWFNGYVDN